MLSASPALRIVIALAALVGCKRSGTTGTAPDERVVPDDIAQIEARLARNADDLQAAGVVVVARRTETAAPETPTEPSGDAAAPEAEEPAAGEEADATAMEPEPESAPSPAMAPRDDDAPKRRTRARRFERRDARQQDDRCERICDLAEATCDLADRICDLASRHPDEVRYETACDRAEDQCDAAADACNACAL